MNHAPHEQLNDGKSMAAKLIESIRDDERPLTGTERHDATALFSKAVANLFSRFEGETGAHEGSRRSDERAAYHNDLQLSIPQEDGSEVEIRVHKENYGNVISRIGALSVKLYELRDKEVCGSSRYHISTLGAHPMLCRIDAVSENLTTLELIKLPAHPVSETEAKNLAKLLETAEPRKEG